MGVATPSGGRRACVTLGRKAKSSLTVMIFSGLLPVTCFLAALPGHAQVLPPQVEPRPEEAPRPQPPTPPPELEVPELRLPGRAPPGAEEMQFTLQNLVIEGSTVYPPATLEALYADRLGQRVSVQKIFEIAAAIETKYREDGYILTRAVVPAQRIEGGIVHIRVVEGYV